MSELHKDNNGTAPEVHWLYRRATIPKLWLAGSALLALTIVLDFKVDLHAHFGFADWISFNAFYGFFSCVLMVLFAKGLALFVKRPDDYYSIEEPSSSGSAPADAASDEAVR
jgi:hypothetical protein